MKNRFIILLALVLSLNSIAQNTVIWNKCLDAQEDMAAMYTTEALHFEGCNGWVVGGYYNPITLLPFNIVLHTANCGDTWDTTIIPGSQGLRDVFFLNEDTGFVVGSSGGFFKTIDGGANWTEPGGTNLSTSDDLYEITFVNDATGYIGGNNGMVYKTIDGGNTWQGNDLGGMIWESITFYDENNGFVSGTFHTNGGTAYSHYTLDGGDNWLDPTNSFFFTQGQYLDENTIYSATTTNENNISFSKSTNGGESGQFITSLDLSQNGTKNALFGDIVHFADANHGFILNHRTSDGGLTWDSNWDMFGYEDTLVSVFTIGQDSAIVTSRSGNIYRSFQSSNCDLQVDAGNGVDTFCAPGIFQLGSFPTAQGGLPPYTYNWSNTDTLSAANDYSNANPTVTFYPFDDDTVTYTLSVIDDQGCVAVDEVAIYINHLGVIGFLEDTICTSGSTFLGTNGLTALQGLPPYTFQWSNDSLLNGNPNNPIASVNEDTQFIVQIEDNWGCRNYDTVFVDYNQNAVVADAGPDTIIVCNGSAVQLGGEPAASGGDEPYTYEWTPVTYLDSPDSSNPIAAFPQESMYFQLSVIDSEGCMDVDSAYLLKSFVFPEIEGPAFTEDTFCSGASLEIGYGPGDLVGTAPYSFNWTPSDYLNCDTCMSPICSPADDILYSVMIQDANGCNGIDTFIIVVPPTIELTVTSPEMCENGLPYYQVDNGALPYTFEFIPAPDPNFSGPYVLILTDGNGCADIDSIPALFVDTACVWPGDANYDGIANVDDLFPIGLAYDEIGPIRATNSILWESYPAQNWDSTFADGYNFKHADCDGNGIVNSDDTLAITENYGLTHAKNSGVEDIDLNAPDLYFEVNAQYDTLSPGTQVFLPVNLGNENIPAEEVYGIVFSIYFDTALVTAQGPLVSFENSWFGEENVDFISIQKLFYNEGRLDVGMVRINQQNVSGEGEIAQLEIVMQDDISGKNSNWFLNAYLDLDNAKMINFNQEDLEVNVMDTNLVITEIEESIKASEAFVKLYPQPAFDMCYVNSSENILDLKVFDMNGNIILNEINLRASAVINTQNLSTGLYFIQLKTKSGTINKKLSVISN